MVGPPVKRPVLAPLTVYSSTTVYISYLQETHLPCRPTNPDVKMTFFKYGSEISDKLELFNLKYDPKIGLTIIKGLISHHSGKYFKAEHGWPIPVSRVSV